jgi:hypothetical protein
MRVVALAAAMAFGTTLVVVVSLGVTSHGPAQTGVFPSSNPSSTIAQIPATFRRYTVEYALFNGPQSEIRIVPLDGNPERVIHDSAPSEAPLRTGDSLALIHDGTAYRLAAPFRTQPPAVGRADHLFQVPDPGTLGVARGGGSSPVTAEVTDAFGNATVTARLPSGYQPIAYFGREFLLQQLTSPGELGVWMPAAVSSLFGRSAGHSTSSAW